MKKKKKNSIPAKTAQAAKSYCCTTLSSEVFKTRLDKALSSLIKFGISPALSSRLDSKGPFLSECRTVLSICFVWGGGKDFRDMDKVCTFLSIPQKGKRWLSQLYGQTKHDSHTVNITYFSHMFLGEAYCATLLAHYLG